jgi:soluble lytic murein transglycosylase
MSRFHLIHLCVAVAATAVIGTTAPAQAREEVDASRAESSTELVWPTLSDSDIDRYRRIFALQEDGRWKEADRAVRELDDGILMGHVLFQRYMHPTKYRSSFAELSKWMGAYADHPGADRIYKLALRRKPAKAKAPTRPQTASAPRTTVAQPERQERKEDSLRRSRTASREVRRMQAHIRDHVRRRNLKSAIAHLDSKPYIDRLTATERDELFARVAAGYFFIGLDEEAVAAAVPAASRSKGSVPDADRMAGLALWRLGRPAEAAGFFESMARSPDASDRDQAAGAFWAARAHLAGGQPQPVLNLLQIAAGRPRTFYGQIARRLLGISAPLEWTAPSIPTRGHAELVNSDRVRRAIALSQVDELYWAEREIRNAFIAASPDQRETVLALAVDLELPGAALRFARNILGSGGEAYDRALFPLPPWEPEDGFSIDRALVYAFMRQESAFNSRATSGQGARGLMQLMPATASFIARDRSLRGRNKQLLYSPEFNVALGQKYIEHLMSEQDFSQNLVKVAAAYNGGPGNLRKWQRSMKSTDDPLLYIESLPSGETREFVRRVLTNMWIYRTRLGQPTPSLDALAAGYWPLYESLDAQYEAAGTEVSGWERPTSR